MTSVEESILPGPGDEVEVRELKAPHPATANEQRLEHVVGHAARLYTLQARALTYMKLCEFVCGLPHREEKGVVFDWISIKMQGLVEQTRSCFEEIETLLDDCKQEGE